MSSIERSQSIVPHKRVSLTSQQREVYKVAILPFVDAAREAYKPMQEIAGQLKFLSSEEDRIDEQINKTQGSTVGRHPLSAALTGIKLARAALEQTPINEEWERFRLRANKLIIQVNGLKAGFAVENGILNERETSLVGQRQLSQINIRNRFLSPNSPTRPHNDLGQLAIYRSRSVELPMAKALRQALQEAALRNTDLLNISSDAALAVVNLVPRHLLDKASSDAHMQKEMAGDLANIAYSVASYDAGLTEIPTDEELGLRGPMQDEYISRHLSALLAHYLKLELVNPNMSEKQIQDTYQQLSNFIRSLAKFVTSRYENVASSYERIGVLIEGLPGLEGSLLASRLSTNLYQDLGLPCLDFASELRVAELLRNIGASRRWVGADQRNLHTSGYIIRSDERFRLEKIMDSLNSRVDENEFDCQKLFEALESTGYGENIIENLFSIIEEDQQDILLKALAETSCFPKLVKQLVHERNAFEWEGYDSEGEEKESNEGVYEGDHMEA